MYTRASKITTSSNNLSNYVEGIDLYNSKLLNVLAEVNVEKTAYEITAYEYRPDLIARDFYGSEEYAGFVMLQAARGLETLTRGSYILLIPKNALQYIISNIK